MILDPQLNADDDDELKVQAIQENTDNVDVVVEPKIENSVTLSNSELVQSKNSDVTNLEIENTNLKNFLPQKKMSDDNGLEPLLPRDNDQSNVTNSYLQNESRNNNSAQIASQPSSNTKLIRSSPNPLLSHTGSTDSHTPMLHRSDVKLQEKKDSKLADLKKELVMVS